jgi:hypothetical protein
MPSLHLGNILDGAQINTQSDKLFAEPVIISAPQAFFNFLPNIARIASRCFSEPWIYYCIGDHRN